MNCQKCASPRSIVLDTRVDGDQRLRQRACQGCFRIFFTREVDDATAEADYRLVVATATRSYRQEAADARA